MTPPKGLEGVRGLLVDVDGTLLDGDSAIPGAAAALERARSAGLSIRLTTNTTRRPRSAVARALDDVGIRVRAEEVLLPASLARSRILRSGRKRAGLLVPEACREDFDGVVEDEERPDWVVLGDLGAGFTFERLNRGFGWLREGASFIALHKNKFWRTGDGSVLLDAGPFVAALEFATGTEAELVGKPARPFFTLALDDIGLAPGQVMVVGDDLENDIAGGAAAGCLTALVRTGNFRGGSRDAAGTRPDLLLDTIAEIPV